MRSLLLDQTAWDLVLTASGDIAVCTEPYSLAQDVANACRLFSAELYYDTSKGIPYRQDILGHWPPLPIVRARLVEAALTVPGVVSAHVVITQLAGRTLTGQILIIDATGAANNVTF